MKVLLLVLAAVACASAHNTLRVMCDDISRIHADGKELKHPGTNRWNALATVKVPTNTRTIQISCKNTGGPYGLLADLRDSKGKIIDVTNGGWQCSNHPSKGFTAAIRTTNQGTFNKYKGIGGGRWVIWNRSGPKVGTVYCKKSYPVYTWSTNGGLTTKEAAVVNNVDYWGADIKNFRSTGPRQCYTACRALKGCVAFTMRKSDGHCWLKKKHFGAVLKKNQNHLISANLVRVFAWSTNGGLSSKQAVVVNNVDYWGADIRNFRSKSESDCYAACRKQAGCVSFTMRKSDFHCWLKNRYYGAVYKKNQKHLISANMVNPDNTLRVMCDDISRIYADGKELKHPGTNHWNRLATVKVPAATKTIQISCKNTGGPYGLLADLRDSKGKIIDVTNGGWQCSNHPSKGFSAAAKTTNQRTFNGYKGIGGGRWVIWNRSGPKVGTVYCRKGY